MNALRNTILALAALAALLACANAKRQPVGAVAVPSPPGEEDCVWFRMVHDWSPVDRDRLIIWGPGRQPYLATLAIPSYDVDWQFAIGLQDRDNDSRICGHGFDAVVLRGSMPDRINIISLKRIGKDAATELLKAANPRYKARKPGRLPADEGVGAEAPPAG